MQISININCFRLLVLLISLLLVEEIVTADIVILKNGDRLEGIVEPLRNEPDSILFRNSSGTIKINRNKIHQIISEPPAISHLKIGNQFLQNEEFESALSEFQLALELDPELTEAQNRINYTRQLLKNKQAEADQLRLQQIEQLIASAKKSEQELDFEKALRQLNEAERLYPSERQQIEIKQIRVLTLIELGKQQLDRFNERAASDTFQKALELDPNNEVAQNLLLQIWEKDPSRRDDVIATYEKLLSARPQDKTIILKLANAYYDKQDFIQAMTHYEKLLGESGQAKELSQTRIRQIITRLYTDAAQKGNYADALNYYKKFLEIFPSEDPTPLYIYEYADRKQKIAPSDFDARLELVKFCQKNNLNEYAEKELIEILKLEPQNRRALDEIAQYAAKAFEEAEFFFNNKEYTLAIESAQKILDKYPWIVTIVQKSNELIERANNELRRIQRQREAEARVLVTRGNEYYQRAQEFINSMRSTERRNNVRIVSDREEAKKFLRRAIIAWEKALELDPSLGEVASEDLKNKLNDAKHLLGVLENPVPMPFPVPRRPTGRY
ncbi:MAG: hypothetical protein N2246_04880 [Candidatus Sumerlaeia bacterium]|nr:hypothetical protein [Candidatus Sumerlaeia bacterium]